MRHLLSDTPERSHAHDLERILRSTQSLLVYYSPYLNNDRSLRILDLALITAIADLQKLDASPDGASVTGCAPEAL